MRRIPIRLRLTAAFAVVMTLVLAGVGVGTVAHFGAAFDEAIDANLAAHTRELATGLPGRARIMVTPAAGGTLILVVAASLAGRDRALADVRGELAVALPLVLLIATAGAYLLAAAALRPVDRMRARAAAITADTP